MNAVTHMAARMAPATVRRLAARRANRFDSPGSQLVYPDGGCNVDTAEATEHVIARWSGDLCGLLNAMTRGELADLARAYGLDVKGRSGALREAMWQCGAALERHGVEISPSLQPPPVLLGGHLVVQAAPRGLHPTSERWPRVLPPCAVASAPGDEPETVDELLAAADRAIGVRLGPRGRDKGAWGGRAASLLGLVERGLDEPDWRGDVEVKTVPVAQEATGYWRVVEDPAIAMVGHGGIAKLQRTLWLARASIAAPGVDDDATIVSWYLLDWDPEVARLARRYLHERPKGPAGTSARGTYLHKRFFADAGMLSSLNGWAS